MTTLAYPEPGFDEAALASLRRQAAAEEQHRINLRNSNPREMGRDCREPIKQWQSRLRALKLVGDVEFRIVGNIPSIPVELAPHVAAIKHELEAA